MKTARISKCALVVAVLLIAFGAGYADAAPTVDNATGPTADSPTTATLYGQVVATNGAAPSIVRIYFGDNEGDTTPSSWNTNFVISTWNEGEAFSTNVTGLYYGNRYYYTVYASNTYGEAWSTVTNFTTLAPTAWSPSDIASLKLWLDADDASTITLNGNAVSQWNDKSSHGRHVSQSVSGSQPGYASSTVSFDGTADYLWNSSPFMYTNGQIDVFLVAAVNTGLDDRIIAEGYDSDNDPIYSFGTFSGNASQMGVFVRGLASNSYGINHAAVSAINAFTGTSRIYQWRDTGTIVSGRVNGGTEVSTAGYIRPASSFNRFAIGGLLRSGTVAATPAAFNLNEIVISDNLSSDDRELVEGYLAWKWGLEGNLPSGHSYTNSDPRSTPIGIANTVAVPASNSAELGGTLDATQSVFTVYAAYSVSNNTSAAEWEADDTKTLVLDAAYTNVMGQAISVTVGSLDPETTYYYTLVASNAVTNIWASPGVVFTTLASAVNPSVTTNDGAFAVGYTTASLRGEMTAGGNADVYICWGETVGNTTSTSSWANVVVMGSLSDGDVVTNNLTGLSYSTEHHYVVYATNAASNAWSSVATFTTDTPGNDRYATGTFTWSTSDNAWSFASGGPYDQPWEAGKNAILEGTGTTLSTVTLGENIAIAHLKINANNYRITANALNFAVAGTITNLGNSVHIISGISGEPDVYVNQANGWSLDNPAAYGNFGTDGFKLLPNSAAMAIGTIHRGVVNYFWLGGSVSTNTVSDNPHIGTPQDITYVDGTGTWAVNKLYGGEPFQIKGGTLIANGELTARSMIELEGGVLHVNDEYALGSNIKPLYIEGGDLDNSSGAPVASAYNFAMQWSSDWTFVGSQGANSDLNLGAGAVTMYADRTVTVANAAATLTVGGVVSANAGNPYSLTKAGPGTLVLTGNNTYTGDTTVDGGVLGISQPYLSSISSVYIADSAVLDLSFSGTNDVFAVFTNGVAGPGGTWGSLASSADNKTAFITGTGILNVPQAEVLEGIRYWDGGTSDIGEDGNALSTGGGGTWNTSLKNWDAGAGVAHTNWNNAGTDLAFFKGAAGTVTVTESITLGALRFDNVDGYTIQGGTLNFAPGGSITNSSTSSVNFETELTISSAITGAPDVQSALGGNTFMEFTPTAGSVELGALVGPGAYRFGGTADGSAASVSTKLRVSGSGIWTVIGDVNAYEHWVASGTLVVNGLLRGATAGVHLSGGTVVVNGTTSGAGFDMTGGTIKGTGVMSGSALVVPAAGTLAPGNPTGTLTITNNNCTIAGVIQISINESLSPVSGGLDVNGTLDISAATLSIDLTGAATESAYVVAEYDSLVGVFSTISGIPHGYTLDYTHQDGNVIAIRRASPSIFRFR